jgi:hypothetical protein
MLNKVAWPQQALHQGRARLERRSKRHDGRYIHNFWTEFRVCVFYIGKRVLYNNIKAAYNSVSWRLIYSSDLEGAFNIEECVKVHEISMRFPRRSSSKQISRVDFRGSNLCSYDIAGLVVVSLDSQRPAPRSQFRASETPSNYDRILLNSKDIGNCERNLLTEIGDSAPKGTQRMGRSAF